MPYKVGLPPEQGFPKTTGVSPISNKPVIVVTSGDGDPILPSGAWVPVFKELHKQAVKNKEFDYGWLRAKRPDLYHAIKAKENELDVLRDAHLSEVMKIVREWRELILQAEFEWKATGEEIL